MTSIPSLIKCVWWRSLVLHDNPRAYAAVVPEASAGFDRHANATVGVGIAVHATNVKTNASVDAHPHGHFSADKLATCRNGGGRCGVTVHALARSIIDTAVGVRAVVADLFDNLEGATRRLVRGFARANGEVHGDLVVHVKLSTLHAQIDVDARIGDFGVADAFVVIPDIARHAVVIAIQEVLIGLTDSSIG